MTTVCIRQRYHMLADRGDREQRRCRTTEARGHRGVHRDDVALGVVRELVLVAELVDVRIGQPCADGPVPRGADAGPRRMSRRG
jgi:hypothetical protein